MTTEKTKLLKSKDVIMVHLKGLKYGAFVGGFLGFIGLALYPIIIHPMTHVEEYKQVQKINRQGINQEEIQPGGMKVWSDPFDRKKS